MIEIQKSATADTRTCDFANVSKAVLLASFQNTVEHLKAQVVIQQESK